MESFRSPAPPEEVVKAVMNYIGQETMPGKALQSSFMDAQNQVVTEKSSSTLNRDSVILTNI